MKIKILQIRNTDEVGKSGKPYVKCSIKTLNTQNVPIWINGFGNNTTKSWKQDQIVDLDIYEDEYNGKKYLKFNTPQDINVIDLLQEIILKLDWLIGAGKVDNGMPGAVKTAPPAPAVQGVPVAEADPEPPLLPPKEEIKVEEIPF